MSDEKTITPEDQIHILSEQVGKLEQQLADLRGVHSLLKSEHKMRLDQGEQLIEVHAALEAATLENARLRSELAAKTTNPQETDAAHPE